MAVRLAVRRGGASGRGGELRPGQGLPAARDPIVARRRPPLAVYQAGGRVDAAHG